MAPRFGKADTSVTGSRISEILDLEIDSNFMPMSLGTQSSMIHVETSSSQI